MRAAAVTSSKYLGANTRHAHNKPRNNDEGRAEHMPARPSQYTTQSKSLLFIAHLRFHLA